MASTQERIEAARAKTRRDLAEWRSRGRSVAQGSAGLFGAVN